MSTFRLVSKAKKLVFGYFTSGKLDILATYVLRLFYGFLVRLSIKEGVRGDAYWIEDVEKI